MSEPLPPNGYEPPSRPRSTADDPRGFPLFYPSPMYHARNSNAALLELPAVSHPAESSPLSMMTPPWERQLPGHGMLSAPSLSGGLTAHARSHNPRNPTSFAKRKAVEVGSLSDSDSDFRVVLSCPTSSRKQPKLIKISSPAQTSASSASSSAGGSRNSGPNSQPRFIAINSGDEYGDRDSRDGMQTQRFAEHSQQERDGEELEIYGITDEKVVDIDYFNGIATVGERVLFCREPDNRYDRNTIRVENVNHIQIGNMPHQVAAKLAPLLDSRTIHLEGTVSEQVGTFELSITIKIYGPTKEPFKSQAKAVVAGQGLTLRQLVEQQSREEQERQRKAVEERRRAQEARDRARLQESEGWGGATPTGSESTVDVQSGVRESPGGLIPSSQPQISDWEDLLGDCEAFNTRKVGVGLVMDSFGLCEADLKKMVKAKQPERLETELLPYQLQGLGWLLQQEHLQPPEGDDRALWRKIPGNEIRCQSLDNLSLLSKPKLSSGGILADDMGLGKTIQMISLIIADVAQERELVPQPIVGLGESTAGTLIVAPVSVMSNWTGQIARHVSKETPLKAFTYHGANRSKANLSDYDIVVTSYGTLSSEFGSKPPTTGIYSLKWRRIVLDEAHHIRNPTSKASQSVTSLTAESRWCLTGTPIINSIKDLYSLVRFLKFPYKNIASTRMGLFADVRITRELMHIICLRRTKDMTFVKLGLPTLNEYVHKVKWWKEEREKYDVLVQEAKERLDRYSAANRGATVEGNARYRFLMEVLLRMRQMCNHRSLYGERLGALKKLAGKDRVELTEENKVLLQDVLQLAIEAQEDCYICLESLHNPRITICKHVFGLECIEKVIELQHKCPLCRTALKSPSSTLIEPATISTAEETEEAHTTAQKSGSSSKIEAVLKILRASHTKDPTTKTIVFSQWTRFLSLLEPFLSQYSISFTRIDGTMTTRQRDAALLTFANDQDCRVLLASLSVTSVGINLIAANQVILSDCWWAPAIEDQAVDRVYRLGQKRNTTVFRLVMEDSIEEHVLKVQEKKRMVVKSALGPVKKKGRREAREARLGDLVMLFGGQEQAQEQRR